MAKNTALKLVSDPVGVVDDLTERRGRTCSLAGTCPIRATTTESNFSPTAGVFALVNHAGDVLHGMTDMDIGSLGKLMHAIDKLNLEMYRIYQQREKPERHF